MRTFRVGLRRASLVACIVIMSSQVVEAKARVPQDDLVSIYRHAERTYDVPWAVLAAIDRYAQLTKSKSERQEAPYYGYAIPWALWVGGDNPDGQDVDPGTIRFFGGLGMDADGDQLALPWDQRDRIAVLAKWLDGASGEDDQDTAIWDLFQDPLAVDRISAFGKIFNRYGIHPDDHCFPVSRRYRYDVKHSFGAGRSWGGRRIHEGVDIFAHYGTPVLASCYGYVELKGWNRYGGWRIGIRDTNNIYYYYAHLSRYPKGLHQGDVVKPGEVIGYVGSSGYGPPGTSGKFPPHLHFGMYRDTGRTEWAFDPSGPLRYWERIPQKVTMPDSE